MPKALVVDDGKRYLDVPESFIRLKERLGDVNFASQDAEKLIKTGLTTIPQPIQETEGIYTREQKPKKWIKPRSLKELVRESKDPKLEVYQRLIKLWPEIREDQLKEIMEHVDPGRLAKVLDLCQVTGKSVEFFNEFLARELTYQQYNILDNLYNFYLNILPRYDGIEKILKEENSVEYPIEIDGKTYKFKVWFLIHGAVAPLDFYFLGFKKVLGVPKTFLSCYRNISKKIGELIEKIQREPKTEYIEQLRYAIIDKEAFEKEILEINPVAAVTFPPRYNLRRIYILEYTSPFICSYCGINHHYLTVIKW
jgi:hypothetical protein